MLTRLSMVVAALLAAALLTGGTAAAATTQEAEAAQLTGGARVETEHPGYTGTGYVGGFVDANKGNATAMFTFTGVTAGGADLTVRYANGTGGTRTMSLVVNGSTRQISLPATANWDTWATSHQAVTLTGGNNTIGLRYGTGDNGNVNVDNAAVAPLPAGLEAESAQLSGGAVVESEHPGYSGTGYVGGFVDANKGNATAMFTLTGVTAGDRTLTIRYANGTGGTRTMSLVVNGSTRQISLPATANWDTWGTTAEPVTLTAGTNTVAIRYGTADNGNVNVDNLALTTALPATGGELETAFLSGGATTGADVSGYTGSGFVTGLTAVGARVVRTVHVPTAGAPAVTLRFRNPTGGGRTLSLYANGLRQGQVTLPAGDWQTVTHTVPMRAGVNLLGYQVDQGDTGGVQLDNVAVAGSTALDPRGATLPYTTYEAEAGGTTGRVLAADRTYTTRQAEASGRRAVELTGIGQYVQVTLTKPANAITVRASIPDNAAGTGTTAPLAVYAGGSKVADLTLTSRYSWMYGPYPFAGAPGGERPHRYFDDSRTTLPATYPAGTVLRLAKETTAVDTITVDLVDAEVADPALSAPTGYVNVNSYGAVPNDADDDTAAVRSAIAAAKSSGTKGVWIPAGRYVVGGLIEVAGVSVRGAGIWHTVLQGVDRRGGFMATGSNVQLADFTFDGDVTTRDPDGAPNSDAAIEGDFGTGSLVHHVATNHAKVGLWVKGDTNGLLASVLRVRNTMADGVNVNGNATGVRVEQSTFRNTGDDALAMWSYAGIGGTVRDSVFAFDTVSLPILANGAAVYGGANNRIEDTLVTDTVFQGSGITVSNWHDATPFSATTTVQRNTLTRTGTHSLDWGSDLGALWLYAPSTAFTGAVVLRDLTVNDSTYQGLLTSWQQAIPNLTVDRVTFTGTGTTAMEFNTPGNGIFSNVTVTANNGPPLANNSAFTITRGPGNTGW